MRTATADRTHTACASIKLYRRMMALFRILSFLPYLCYSFFYSLDTHEGQHHEDYRSFLSLSPQYHPLVSSVSQIPTSQRLRSSSMYRHVAWKVPSISTNQTAFIFRVKQSLDPAEEGTKVVWNVGKRYSTSITSQKT